MLLFSRRCLLIFLLLGASRSVDTKCQASIHALPAHCPESQRLTNCEIQYEVYICSFKVFCKQCGSEEILTLVRQAQSHLQQLRPDCKHLPEDCRVYEDLGRSDIEGPGNTYLAFVVIALVVLIACAGGVVFFVKMRRRRRTESSNRAHQTSE